ncbi:uncharacterized protein C8Q71DRAFT_773996 [Rhodofomes roseus]|uniref:Uncharacterized protein n=1 Tax=Rhodofomes roseus TaxID=34475 RepID=A0ABQ8K9C6_9APHY|nr:uncharacterized protein C8Q71DRAFT_773996 [Rhodofomes roseus]KAH9833560.1 hypothetical protein C8Q71DRAFT_773996 [Rhodofomes roseus]
MGRRRPSNWLVRWPYPGWRISATWWSPDGSDNNATVAALARRRGRQHSRVAYQFEDDLPLAWTARLGRLPNTHSPVMSSPTAADGRSTTSDWSSKRLPRESRSSICHGRACTSTAATDPSHASAGTHGGTNKSALYLTHASMRVSGGSIDHPFSTRRKGDFEPHVRTHFTYRVCGPEWVSRNTVLALDVPHLHISVMFS